MLERFLIVFAIVSTVRSRLNESLIYYDAGGEIAMEAVVPICSERRSASAALAGLRAAEAFLYRVTELNENPETVGKYGYAVRGSCGRTTGLSLFEEGDRLAAFFSIRLSCRAQAVAAVDLVLASSSWKRAVVIVSGDECGLDNLRDFRLFMNRLGAHANAAVSYVVVVDTNDGSLVLPRDVVVTDVNGTATLLRRFDDAGIVLLTAKETAIKLFRQFDADRLSAIDYDWVIGGLWGEDNDNDDDVTTTAWDYFSKTVAQQQRQQPRVWKVEAHVGERKSLNEHFDAPERHSKTLVSLRREIYGDDCETNCDRSLASNDGSLVAEIDSYVMGEAVRAAARLRDKRTLNRSAAVVALTEGGIRFVEDPDDVAVTFRPHPRRFNLVSLVPDARNRGDFIVVSRSPIGRSVSIESDCAASKIVAILFIVVPVVAFLCLLASTIGLLLNRNLLPTVYRFIYVEFLILVSVVGIVVSAVLTAVRLLPLDRCDHGNGGVTTDFVVVVLTSIIFSAVAVAVISHRVKILGPGVGRAAKPSLVAVRFVALVALFLIFSGVQIALATVASFVDSCDGDGALFYVSHAYSSALGFVTALFALVKPLPIHDSFEYQYHTKSTRVVLFVSAAVHLCLNVIYLAVYDCKTRHYLLVVLASFPLFYIAALTASLVVFVRHCYNCLTKEVPIQIELINPLQEMMLARTADIWSNKYAGSMRIKNKKPGDWGGAGMDKGGTLGSRQFPFQISDRELIKEVKPVFIKPERLMIGVYIGGGNFGQVFRGTLDGDTSVAVKTIRGSFSHEELEDFLKEGLRMKDFDHPNVMRLIGIGYGRPVDQESESGVVPVCVLPYMARGDLKRYLMEGRPGQPMHSEFFRHPVLNQIDLALQVARGMLYLSEQRIVHRDLAARNCMVDDGGRVMVGDFGLARSLEGVIYRQKKNICLPFMWMAIESLIERTFSTASDVWSYGITLWEIMTYGQRPYRGIYSSDGLVEYLLKGKRMAKPYDCHDKIYNVMALTWQGEYSDRPSFDVIIRELERCASQLKGGRRGDTAVSINTENDGIDVPDYSYDHLQREGNEDISAEEWYKRPRPLSDFHDYVNEESRYSGIDYVNCVTSEAQVVPSYVSRMVCAEIFTIEESLDMREIDNENPFYVNYGWTRTSTSGEKETTL